MPGIELGTAVVPTYPRHPAVLAQQALTAALAIGPGRLALGIGLSHKVIIEDMYGYPSTGLVHMREYLRSCSRCWTARAVSVEGSTVSAHIGLSRRGRTGSRCCSPRWRRGCSPGRRADRRHDPVDDRARHRLRLLVPVISAAAVPRAARARASCAPCRSG